MKEQLIDIIKHYDALKYALLEAQSFDENHFGFPEIYYDIMESDQARIGACLLYTSPSPRDLSTSRMPSSA